MLLELLAITSACSAQPRTAARDLTCADAPRHLRSATSGAEQTQTDKKQTPEGSPAQGEDGAAPGSEPEDRSDQPVPVPRFTWTSHPSFRYGGLFRLDVEAKIHEDARASDIGASGVTTWELHRSRIGIQGDVLRHFEYEVERELAEQVDVGKTTKTPWKDVFVNVAYLRWAQVQAGKFKIPFGLDQLTGVSNLDFAHRTLGARYLAPARDVGVMVHGRVFKRGLSYWAGVFRQDGENARSSTIHGADRTFAARVTGTPFRAMKVPGLGALDVGAAITLSPVSQESFLPNGLRGRTVLTQDSFFDPVYVNGRRRRFEADLDWAPGPISARAEYTLVADERRGQGLGNEDLSDARAQSWYVSGSWVMSGERKARPLRPKHELFRGGIGALELGARYERLWFDSAGGGGPASRNPRAERVLSSADRVFTVGVNWYVNRWIKVQVNAIREQVEDDERSPTVDGAAFWSRIVRFQLGI